MSDGTVACLVQPHCLARSINNKGRSTFSDHRDRGGILNTSWTLPVETKVK
jgi:hypothetical protein